MPICPCCSSEDVVEYLDEIYGSNEGESITVEKYRNPIGFPFFYPLNIFKIGSI